MISILIFVVCCIIGSTIGYRLAAMTSGDSFIPKALKPKKKVPNYEFIAQADREIFGIEPGDSDRPQDTVKEIEGLAGYTTRLRKDYDGDLVCELIAPKGGVVETGYVYTRDYVDYRARTKTQLTPAQLEVKVTKKFELLIEDRKAKLASEAAMKNLMDKFNNKAVER